MGEPAGSKQSIGAWVCFALAAALLLLAAGLVVDVLTTDCGREALPAYCEGNLQIGWAVVPIPVILSVFAFLWGRVLVGVAKKHQVETAG